MATDSILSGSSARVCGSSGGTGSGLARSSDRPLMKAESDCDGLPPEVLVFIQPSAAACTLLDTSRGSESLTYKARSRLAAQWEALGHCN